MRIERARGFSRGPKAVAGAVLALVASLVLGCGSVRVPAADAVAPAHASLDRRAFAPSVDGQPVLAGVAYGPHREGQRPGGPAPTTEQLVEDLRIIARHWAMIRTYSTADPAERILRVIEEEKLPIRVVQGVWIAPDAPNANATEVREAIRLARAHPERIAAISVGNETQVSWSDHRTPEGALIGHLREVRAAVSQPVTTAEDWAYWVTEGSRRIAAEVDFVFLHAHPLWNRQPLSDAMAWTDRTVAAVAGMHAGVPLVLGEVGWSSGHNATGRESKHIVGPTGEVEQATYLREFEPWARGRGLPYFIFEAFDEPWKGESDPRDVEKHWGLFRVDRTPKAALTKGAP